jgi:geranylgeranyl reductase family protein
MMLEIPFAASRTGAVDAEVIVVGGGPAGSATASLLARSGHDVLLLDRAHFPRPKACAEYLSPATAASLARLGVLDAVLARRPARPLGMRLVQGGARTTVRYPDGGAPRRALCLPRETLDAVLLDHARAAGVRVEEGTSVSAATSSREGASVMVRSANEPASAVRRLHCRLLVGADGARSVVAQSLGVQRDVVWPRRVGLVAHYEGAAGSSALVDYGEMHVGRGVYCGLAPLPEGRVSAGLVMDVDEAKRSGGSVAAFEVGLERLPRVRERLHGGARLGPIRGVAPLAARVSRPYGDGFVLVGDAAGFLDPITGEGVYRALRGAELAAKVASEALRLGTVSSALLQGYARLRRREFAAKSALCWVIQGLLVFPPLLGYALGRMEERMEYGDVLGDVLGDYRPAGEALRPQFLWGLLRP